MFLMDYADLFQVEIVNGNQVLRKTAVFVLFFNFSHGFTGGPLRGRCDPLSYFPTSSIRDTSFKREFIISQGVRGAPSQLVEL